MRNLFIGLLIVAAIVVGGGFIAQAAYQAGLSTAITTAAANAPDGTVVTPVAPAYPYGYGYGYGPGWGHGFSIFGFLGTLLVIFLIIGLLRAVFWRGRGWGGGRWGGPGYWGGAPADPAARVAPASGATTTIAVDSRRPSTTGIARHTGTPPDRPRPEAPRLRPTGPPRSGPDTPRPPGRSGRAHPCRYDAAREQTVSSQS